jgi:hypothetical protein
MKTIEKWDDLREYGIEALTSEACGLGYRLLCDVTAKGKKILEKCLGLRDLGAQPAWNCGSADDPHIGSVMLALSMLVPIGIFALLESNCTAVWLQRNDTLRGFEADDDQESIEWWKEFTRGSLVRTFAYRGTAGDRNIHVMSGRAR